MSEKNLFEVLKNTKLVVTDIQHWPSVKKRLGRDLYTENQLNEFTVTLNPDDYYASNGMYKGKKVYIAKRLRE